MGFHFHFRGLESRKELKGLIDFLSLQDLEYPNYDYWVQRTEHELNSGHKQAVLAFSEAHLVGDLIYQQHKEVPCFLELKNLRMHPQLRTRKFAEFMLRQVEAENQSRYDAIILDARANQEHIIQFMNAQGYASFATIPLYQDSMPEVVMLKLLNENKRDAMVISAQKIISAKAV